MPAPTMHYVLPETFTPAHRAQLSRSHKKVEQILGVTPSLVPVPAIPISYNHRRTKSLATAEFTTRDRSKVKERGKLTNLFKREPMPVTNVEKERASVDSSNGLLSHTASILSSSRISSDSASTSYDDLHHERVAMNIQAQRQRPPMLNLTSPLHYPQAFEESSATDSETSHHLSVPRAAVLDRVDIESPLSPTFLLELPHGRKSEETEDDDDVLTDITNQPRRSMDKMNKMSRLARHFGTQPPLELVFPPSPASQSRQDPRRYTFGLPPPFVRGVVADSTMVEGVRGVEEQMQERKYIHPEGKVIKVFWDNVENEESRTRVMNVLRELRA